MGHKSITAQTQIYKRNPGDSKPMDIMLPNFVHKLSTVQGVGCWVLGVRVCRSTEGNNGTLQYIGHQHYGSFHHVVKGALLLLCRVRRKTSNHAGLGIRL